jgi:hypothetical protein
MKTFRAPDGTDWGVDVALPGSSNIMIRFRHPDGRSSSRDRYNWFISKEPEARSVTSRLSPEKVLGQLDDVAIAMLFSRSMPVSRKPSDVNSASGLGGGAIGHSKGIGKVDH